MFIRPNPTVQQGIARIGRAAVHGQCSVQMGGIARYPKLAQDLVVQSGHVERESVKAEHREVNEYREAQECPFLVVGISEQSYLLSI